MIDQLLSHIQSLSDSRISYTTALEEFARCFHSVYGECSFLSLEICRGTRVCHIRLIFRADEALSQQFENFINDNIELVAPQVSEILVNARPVIVSTVSPELAEALAMYQLPAASLMAIPLYLDGELKRWVLVTGFKPDQFKEVDLEQATLLANLASTYMVRIEETQALEKANVWIEKELDDIGRIQKLLLPNEKIELTGTDVAVYFSSCDQAGGDYFDVVNLSQLVDPDRPEGKSDMWGMIIADASGHGAAAAVEIAMFDALLRTYKGAAEDGPAGVFNYTNKYFFTRAARGSFITSAILSYDPDSHILIYANAGHPPSILLTPDKEIIFLDQGKGIPLGVDPDWQWENVSREIEPGSVLISYTDGVIEALSPAHEQFGIERLVATVSDCSGYSNSAEDFIDHIVRAILLHQNKLEQTDDQAVVAIKILGQE